MATRKTTPPNIDAYIAGFGPEVQKLLQQVRQVVTAAAPDAEETISYGIPTFKLNGVLVHFGGFKNHIGFFPPVHGDKSIEQAILPYAGDKGNLRFPIDKSMPIGLIKRIVKLRVKQNRAKAMQTKRRA